MDARAVLHPVGPHEPRVYWTRRAVLLLAAVVVLVLVSAYGCSGGSAHPAASRGTPPPTASSTPSPTASTGTAGCAKSDLSVVASTDASTYAAGVLPHLSVTIRTSGSVACELPARGISWEIVSGTDTVYTTAGCPPAARASFTLRPSHPARTGRIWDRHRSLPGCTSPGAAAAPGTYQLWVTVDGVRSAVAVFHLTG